MRIRIAVPDAHVTPGLLEAALEATTRANESMLENGEVNPISDAIKRGKVKWQPEPFRDGEHFDLQHDVQGRGWGDCDDLAPAYAAELRATGTDPDARAVVRRSGPNRWHALVERGDGRLVDPSVAAGMRQWKRRHGVHGEDILTGVHGVHGAVMTPLSMRECILGLKRALGKWAVRCDLPVHGSHTAICGVALCSDPVDAVERAIDGATIVGLESELVHPYDLARAMAIRSAMSGDDVVGALEEANGWLDPHEVGSIFSSIAHVAKSALPLAGKLVPIPGAGLAADMLSSALPGGGGGGGHRAAAPGAPAAAPAMGPAPGIAAQMAAPPQVTFPHGPTGPIIVRF